MALLQILRLTEVLFDFGERRNRMDADVFVLGMISTVNFSNILLMCVNMMLRNRVVIMCFNFLMVMSWTTAVTFCILHPELNKNNFTLSMLADIWAGFNIHYFYMILSFTATLVGISTLHT